MHDDPTREFKAIVWTQDAAQPVKRVTIRARDAAQARKLLEEQFGTEIVCSIWNEADANNTR